MNLEEVIKSQYQAALAMLKQAIAVCPDSLWDDPAAKNKFWHVAYHALFYTHLYLQGSERHFTPWAKHREEAQFMGPVPWPPHREPHIGAPYSQEELLEYLALCQNEVEAKVTTLDWEGASGFSWLNFSKLELQFYNIRHLQQHIGELSERLGTQGIEIGWVGRRPDRRD